MAGKLLNYPPVILDDFSRFCLDICIVEQATAEATIASLRNAFVRDGKPKEILKDVGLSPTITTG